MSVDPSDHTPVDTPWADREGDMGRACQRPSVGWAASEARQAEEGAAAHTETHTGERRPADSASQRPAPASPSVASPSLSRRLVITAGVARCLRLHGAC